MTYLDTSDSTCTAPIAGVPDTGAEQRAPVVLILDDEGQLTDWVRHFCAFLEVRVERLNSDEPLMPFLKQHRAMAVVTPMEAPGQDGAHVLMTVAQYDRDLPVLLLHEDARLAGAADAVTDLWGLGQVTQCAGWPTPGQIAEFLCYAGLRGNCLAMMPV